MAVGRIVTTSYRYKRPPLRALRAFFAVITIREKTGISFHTSH